MRQQKYLNVILTINAVLLAALVWTQVAERPVLDRTATAQIQSRAVQPRFPNAAQQRSEIVRGLASLQKAVDKNTQILESGRMRVEVTNLSELLINDTD